MASTNPNRTIDEVRAMDFFAQSERQAVVSSRAPVDLHATSTTTKDPTPQHHDTPHYDRPFFRGLDPSEGNAAQAGTGLEGKGVALELEQGLMGAMLAGGILAAVGRLLSA